MFLRKLSALRELGLYSLSQYGLYRLALGSGYYGIRFPVQRWEQVNLSRHLSPRIPADPNGYLAYRTQRQFPSLFQLDHSNHPIHEAARDDIVQEAENILQGRFRVFGIPEVKLGFPPDWHSFGPLSGARQDERVSAEVHWSKYKLEQLPQDVKLLWEPSRFGWVYPLAQAYSLDGDRRYLEGFWTLYASWLEANPPQAGLNWHSAQEVAIRLIALLFAVHAFEDGLREEPWRWTALLKGILVHTERIPPSLSYARAQNNNHLLVECAALYLVGACFPEFLSAQRWRRLGRGGFEAGLGAQVFADGGYVQHSVSYQRLALQTGLLVAIAAQEHGEPLNPSSFIALGRLVKCLSALVDEKSGIPPNFGPNDGAQLLPLSACAHEDFRPSIQAAWHLLWKKQRYASGAWDDLAAWLKLDGDTQAVRQDDAGEGMSDTFPQAGLHIIRQGGLKIVLRAIDFRNRPGHSDQMHLDIWAKRVNLARDPGTYLYNAQPPWDNCFSGSWCHNTLSLDGIDPMLKAGRFLWLNWSRASLLERWKSSEGQIEVLLAKHHSRRWRGGQHQRTLAVVGGEWILVADDVLGEGDHRLALNWNLADLTWRAQESSISLQDDRFSVSLQWRIEDGRWGLYRAGEQVAGEAVVKDPTTYGWHASTYAQRKPGLQLVLQAEGSLPVRMVTLWSFNQAIPDTLKVNWIPAESGKAAFNRLSAGSLEWAI